MSRLSGAFRLIAMAGALAACGLGIVHGAEPDWVEETVTLPAFGKVAVYRPQPVERTRGVILFVSGDGGWNLGVIDMARRSASHTIVVGLSMPAWAKVARKSADRCWYPAGELESTAQAIEKIYRLPRYIKPILAGYSSGATLVYGALAQANGDAFAGAVSLGFCPDLDVARPFCGRGDWKPAYDARRKRSLLPPRPDLPPRGDDRPRWTILQGQIDKVCDPKQVERFAADVPGTRVRSLPKVGHGFSIERNWGEAYDEAIEDLLDPVTAWDPVPGEATPAPAAEAVAAIVARLEALDLPLEITWPEGADRALVFVSGDGGWADLDRRVAAALSAHGVGVVGWNALRYFWQEKTPDRFHADLAALVGALPEQARVFVGGYSFGAEVLPVVLDPRSGGRPTTLERVAGMILLAPGEYASFEVSPLDWILSGSRPTGHSVRAALKSDRGLPVLCLEPSDQEGSGCAGVSIENLTRVRIPGGHHFAGDYEGLAERILAFIAGPAPEPAGVPRPVTGAPGDGAPGSAAPRDAARAVVPR